MDTQAMTAGTGTPTDIQAQRDAIPPLKVELKQLINEVLDERERV